jgi:hypothetical protein
MKRNLLTAAILIVTAACGGSSPTSPGATASNANPAITSLSVTPSFGVSGLTPIAVSAAATDADNDSLTYQWMVGSLAANGASTVVVPQGDGAITVRLTVTDGKGGSATDTRTVTLGTMTGVWTIAFNTCTQTGALPTLTLTQTGTAVAGTFLQTANYCNGTPGQTGRLDPAAPGTIDAEGNFSARLKIGDFIDIYLTEGKMDATGRRVTGKPQGSGFGASTDTFTLTKQ